MVRPVPLLRWSFRFDELSLVEDDGPWHRVATGVIRRADPTNGRVPGEYGPIPAALITPIGSILGRSVASPTVPGQEEGHSGQPGDRTPQQEHVPVPQGGDQEHVPEIVNSPQPTRSNLPPRVSPVR